MINENLQKAIDSLQIQDVYLRSTQARSEDDFDPKYSQNLDSLILQQLHIVRQAMVVEQEDDGQLLRVFITLGARWVEPNSGQENSEPKVNALIEAEFIAEYQIQDKLDNKCIDEFALKNASYHVWPYWREYLASQCERMRLPRLMLPAIQLAHNRHTEFISHQTPEPPPVKP